MKSGLPINESWKPVVGQYASVLNHANELTLMLREKAFPGRELQLVLRAYNDGVAFRYIIPESFRNFGPTIPLVEEITNFTFTADHAAWAANYLDPIPPIRSRNSIKSH
ncbi:MAG: glycoside hydrolase family 97 N-terminal domain-containing protein [Cyclobacteriaceae bacterium]|nr:glycoside hydrolase family 97 N-terminal domain-containing protein [Cyclobacteriaceae bacterium]